MNRTTLIVLRGGSIEPFRNPERLDLDLDRLTIETVTAYKHLDCKHYRLCLDTAAQEDWAQFHCNHCRAYDVAEPTDEEKQALIRLGRLLQP